MVASQNDRAESASLRSSLYSSFVGLVVAQEKVRAQAKILAVREQNAKLIRLKYDSGMESRGNMMYASALADLARSDARKAERALDIARRALLNGMGAAGYRPVTARAELAAPEYELKDGSAAAALGRCSTWRASSARRRGAARSRCLPVISPRSAGRLPAIRN